jgi:hypothetical protein
MFMIFVQKQKQTFVAFVVAIFILLPTTAYSQRLVETDGDRLIKAVVNGDVAETERLLRQNPTWINVTKELTADPLWSAFAQRIVSEKDVAKSDRLRDKYLALNGLRPSTHWLIHLRDERPVRYAPLHYAAASGQVEIAKVLIEQEASANATAKSTNAQNSEKQINTAVGLTPLHFAALAGHAAMTRFLIENKADVEASTSSGLTPLQYASWNRHFEVAELLLSSDAQLDAFSAAAIGKTTALKNCCKGTPGWRPSA